MTFGPATNPLRYTLGGVSTTRAALPSPVEEKPAPVEANPWRGCASAVRRAPLGINPDDRVEVESKLYGGIFRIPAHWVAWENVARWRFAEPQK